MRRLVAGAFYVVAILCLGYYMWAKADAWWAQSALSRELSALVGRHGSGSAQGARRKARANGLVGRIAIPRLKVSAIILEGTTDERLRRGVGHVPGSALPGERGNVVLAAHRDTYFRPLHAIRIGDRVVLTTPDGQFRYRVESTLVVRPTRTDLIGRTSTNRLTLVTCYPFHWVGPAPDRFIVQLRQEPRAPWLASAAGETQLALERVRSAAQR